MPYKTYRALFLVLPLLFAGWFLSAEAQELNPQSLKPQFSSLSLPDLTLEATKSQRGQLSIKVSNISKGTSTGAMPAYVDFVWLRRDNSEIDVLRDWLNSGPLAAGESHTFEWDSNRLPIRLPTDILSPYEDAAKLKLVVDPIDNIVEADEDNNTLILDNIFDIFPAADLVIDSVTLDPITSHPTVSFRNQSEIIVLLSNSEIIKLEWLDAQRNLIGQRILHVGTTPNGSTLRAGNTSLTYTYYEGPPVGARFLRATLDYLHRYRESNEGNNVWEGPLITPETTGEDLVQADEEIVAQELKPKILPGNPFYILKTLGRETRALVTLNSEKDAELRLRFASEKILEANILVDRGQADRAADHLKSYASELEKMNQFTARLEEKDKGTAQKVAERSAISQLEQQILIGKIEREASAEKIAEVKEVRAHTLEQIAKTIEYFGGSEKIEKVLTASLRSDGSPFRSLRNLEILKAVEEKVPDVAKDAIRRAEENSLKRFKSQLETLPAEHRKLLPDYVEKAGGDEIGYLKAFDALTLKGVDKKTEGNLIDAKERVLTKFENRVKNVSAKNPEQVKVLFKGISVSTLEKDRAKKDEVERISQELRSRRVKSVVEQLDSKLSSDEGRGIVFGQLIQSLQNVRASLEELKLQISRDREVDKRFAESQKAERVENRLTKTIQNVGEQLLLLETATGVSKEVTGILNHMREVAGQAAVEEETYAEWRALIADYEMLELLPEESKNQLSRGTLSELRDLILSTSTPKETRRIIDIIISELSRFEGKEKSVLEQGRQTLTQAMTEEKNTRVFLEALKSAQEERPALEEKPVTPIPTSKSTREPALCTQEYKPVCGVDGKTYSNKCVAEKQNKTKIAHEGQCKKEIAPPIAPTPVSVVCPKEYAPVCGTNGKTYENRCIAEKESRIKVSYEGVCKSFVTPTAEPVESVAPVTEFVSPTAPTPTSEPCNKEYYPICGTDSKTYTNACYAKQVGIGVQYSGECKVVTPPPLSTAISCAKDYSPVCGTDSKTYTNECFAAQVGVKVQYYGECKTVTSSPSPAMVYQCSDSVDNDKDGYIDLKDLGCVDSKDDDETNTVSSSPPSPATIAPPKISSFSASPTVITKGGTALLSWNVSGADSVTLSKTSVSVSGSSKVVPTITTTYTLTATNKGGSVDATVTVTVK